jgi:pimeloyl-ACP methyl ester carboxylesterase
VTVVSGRHDHVVPLTNATFLVDRLPHGRSVVLDAGHFVWEEAPDQYASAVLETLN